MASLQDLTRRISSVSNTRKITRAMEMVSAAKLRRAQQRIETLRPFADSLLELTVRVAQGIQGGAQHPLLQEREVERVAIVMFTGDRGLAGALNANILRRSLMLRTEWEQRGAEVRWMAVGKKGVSSLLFRRIEIDQAYRGITDAPKFRDAEEIAQHVIKEFNAEGYDKVVLVYNHFVSAVAQKVIVQDLLPLTDELLQHALTQAGQHTAAAEVAETSKAGVEPDWFFEPDSTALLDRLLPTYVEQTVFRALLESTASEHGARMSAMRNASENAKELIDQITLQRNRARQAKITQEILEIVAGAEAI
jgi:F-type H+-transporting ATPase subunit gamma